MQEVRNALSRLGLLHALPRARTPHRAVGAMKVRYNYRGIDRFLGRNRTGNYEWVEERHALTFSRVQAAALARMFGGVVVP